MLRHREDSYALAGKGVEDAMWDWSIPTNQIFYSSRWKSMLGYADNEIKNDFSEWNRLLHPDDKKAALLKTEQFLNHKTNKYESEFRMQHKDGHYIHILSRAFAVKNEGGEIIRLVGTHVDITERNVHFDRLTNLPNRVLLLERLNQGMEECQHHHNSLAVIFLDIDGFKVVNDRYGYDVADKLLIAISQRMKKILAQQDIIARFAGDEFVAVLSDVATFEDCQYILDQLLLAVSSAVWIGEIVLHVSASIGVTIYPQDNADADRLIRHADQAMYVAKQAGKNCYRLFDTAQHEAANIKQESLGNIRSAFKQQELLLHYQPKVNMSTGEIIGVEALIRWQHPEKGLVFPIDFLPVIERHAISLEIGEWVINTALNQISQWQNRAIDLPISVNISAYQLQQADFVERLAALLVAHPDVPSGYLEIEILETSALSNVHQVSAIMSDCMALGVNFSLDDFGTGYSSLTYLRRLPVHLIKIDQTFVRDMSEDDDDLAIVEGVIALANSFKLEVIAEGVETIEHGTALLQLGCNLAQGYGIARPMPANDISNWMSDWNKKKLLFIELDQTQNKISQLGIYKNQHTISLAILQAAVMVARDGITIADFSQPDHPLIFVNPAFEKMTGYSLEEVNGKNCRYLQGLDTSQQTQIDMISSAINQQESCLVTIRNYQKNGTLFWNELSISPIFDGKGQLTHYVGIQKDVTEKMMLEERMTGEYSKLKKSIAILEHLTSIDPLTGIHNRRYLEEQLKIQGNIAKRNKQLLTIFMIDIDYFKNFNDTYGHLAGDEALKSVAKVLGSSFLKATDFVARYGGEEFIILTIAGEPKLIFDYAESVVRKVAELAIPHSGSDKDILTISLGFNSCQLSQEQDFTDIVKQADLALYIAKASGRNRAVNYSNLDPRTLEEKV